jgi:clan AA aspartic protease (TIGR02281 family)
MVKRPREGGDITARQHLLLFQLEQLSACARPGCGLLNQSHTRSISCWRPSTPKFANESAAESSEFAIETPARLAGIVRAAATEGHTHMMRAHLATLARLLSLVIATAAFSAPAASQGADDMDDLLAVMERLKLKLPTNVYGSDPVQQFLGQLSRERCDQQAIADLGKALERAGYRREASNALVSYSETCGGHAPSLRSAVVILVKLTDYQTAATVASKVIEIEPFGGPGYLQRAVAHEFGGLLQKAIDDYTTAIELYGDKQKIPSATYFGLARSYEKLGQFCDAVLPVETWVSLNPERNGTSQTQAMISTYRSKGQCELGTAAGEEVFAVSRPNSVVKLPVSINGTRGVFLLDTGATFVSMKNSFAQKAKVQVDSNSIVRLNTANGANTARRGRAASIQLRSLQAKDVPIVVHDDIKGSFGEGVDGLLGMSFLSRFRLTIDARNVKISARK